MSDRWERRSVLVTGGAQGIGRGIVLRLLELGARVTAVDVDAEAGAELTAEARSPGLTFLEGDVADEAAAAAAVRSAVASHGGLDGLVNNAGIMASGTPFEQLDLSEFSRILSVNLTGPFLMAKHAAAALRSARGSIVNIASTRALQSEPNTEAYSASKGGLVALTHALAVSLGPEVRVNAVSPGWIDVTRSQKRSRTRPAELREVDHRQHPAGRVGRPEDIAELVVYLLSGAAEFITGQNFVVDGGMTRRMIYVE